MKFETTSPLVLLKKTIGAKAAVHKVPLTCFYPILLSCIATIFIKATILSGCKGHDQVNWHLLAKAMLLLFLSATLSSREESLKSSPPFFLSHILERE